MLKRDLLIFKKSSNLFAWYNRCKLFNLHIKNTYNKLINNYLIYITFLQIKFKFHNYLYNMGLFWEKFYSKLTIEVNKYHQSFINIIYYITKPRKFKRHIIKLSIYKIYNKFFGLKKIPLKYYLNFFYKYSNSRNKSFKHKKYNFYPKITKTHYTNNSNLYNNLLVSNLNLSSSFIFTNYINKVKKFGIFLKKERIAFILRKRDALLKKRYLSIKKVNKILFNLLNKKRKKFFYKRNNKSYFFYNKLYNLYFYWYIFLNDNYLYYIYKTFDNLWLSFFFFSNKVGFFFLQLYTKIISPLFKNTFYTFSDFTFFKWFTLNPKLYTNLDSWFLKKISYNWFFLSSKITLFKDYINIFDNQRRSYKLFVIKKKKSVPILLPFYKFKHAKYYIKKGIHYLLPKKKYSFFSLNI